MKASKDPRVDTYIAKAAPFAQPILRHLRALIHEGCPDVVETVKWGMPSFQSNGRILCGLAAFKAHATFGFWHHGMREVIGTSEAAMSQFGRITRLADLPGDKTMLRYLRAAAKLNASDAPSRPKSKPRPELPTPPDLASALKKNKAAGRAFADFSPSHRREYIEWITEAKRDAMRQQRVATTLEWLSEGKSRHWKYANC